MKAWITVVIATFSLSVFAHEHEMPEVKSNKDFDQIKKLVGTWKGTTKNGDKEEPVTATYELTSGGTAVIEKLFPGTPHEMVSMYHIDGKSASMTHYCMIGNQPQMKVKTSTDKAITFEMTGNKGIKSAKEMHMHAVNIKWDAPNKITEEWTNYKDGKKGDTAVFTFTKQ